MDSPADGDELAPVVPLRRRTGNSPRHQTRAAPCPENAPPFDPELEPDNTPSDNSPPPGIALRASHFALRWRQPARTQKRSPAATSRQYPTALLLTGLAGALLATVAAVMLVSILNPSARSSNLGSLGGRVSAGALEPTKLRVLSASANPFGRRGDAATREATRTAAADAHPKPPGHGRPVPAR